MFGSLISGSFQAAFDLWLIFAIHLYWREVGYQRKSPSPTPRNPPLQAHLMEERYSLLSHVICLILLFFHTSTLDNDERWGMIRSEIQYTIQWPSLMGDNSIQNKLHSEYLPSKTSNPFSFQLMISLTEPDY